MKTRWNWLEGARRVEKVEKATSMQSSRQSEAGRNEESHVDWST